MWRWFITAIRGLKPNRVLELQGSEDHILGMTTTANGEPLMRKKVPMRLKKQGHGIYIIDQPGKEKGSQMLEGDGLLMVSPQNAMTELKGFVQNFRGNNHEYVQAIGFNTNFGDGAGTGDGCNIGCGDRGSRLESQGRAE